MNELALEEELEGAGSAVEALRASGAPDGRKSRGWSRRSANLDSQAVIDIVIV